MNVHYFAHPDRMGVRAALHGLAARSPREAVVVDLACGDGANLVSIAAAYPSSRCIGVDRSDAAIARATAAAAQLGLANVSFVHGDATGSGAAPPLGELPAADYLIALGLVSTVAPDARKRLLERIARTLAPGGSAVVSFVTAPGDSEIAPLRALMRFHVKNIEDPATAVREAREISRWHAERTGRFRVERSNAMKRLIGELDALDDRRLLEMLYAPDHHPLTIRELAGALAEVGLQWLSNARMDEPRAQHLPGLIRELAQYGDVIRRQQYLDCFLYTRDRTSIVCRADEQVVREVSARAFERFHVAGRVSMRTIDAYASSRPVGEALVVESPAGTAVLSHPGAHVLTLLAEHVPVAIPIEALFARTTEIEASAVLSAVAELWLADVIELALTPPAVASVPPERPTTGLLQRLAATAANGSESAEITSLWHRPWKLDAAELDALRRMDGSVARDDLDSEALRKLAHKGFIAA